MTHSTHSSARLTEAPGSAGPRPDARCIIVGAGLSGCCLAVLLANRGWEVRVLELRSDPRAATGDEGRSINLAVSRRGLDALSAVGCREETVSRAMPLSGRIIHPLDGPVDHHPYGTAGQTILSVERGHLNRVLIETALAHPRVQIAFDAKVAAVDVDAPSVTLENGTVESADLVVGADGAWSKVRQALARYTRLDVCQSFLDHGYQELTVSPDDSGRHRFDPTGLHIWPRADRMAIALPNDDGTFTATTFWPHEGPHGYASISTAEDLAARMQEDYPDLSPHLTDLVADHATNPVGDLVSISCDPWHHRDRVVLIGDASHAIVPFYGQGANAALEDCLVLCDLLDAHPRDRGRALAAFTKGRRPDAEALSALTMANFIEMRDQVDHPRYRLRHAAERRLTEALGERFQTRYQMVTFSRMPYAEVERRARRQEQLVELGLVASALAPMAAVGALARRLSGRFR